MKLASKWTFSPEDTMLHRFAFTYEILLEILDKKRLHDQDAYHSLRDGNGIEYDMGEIVQSTPCNTAHCVAGWMINDFMIHMGLQHSYKCGTPYYNRDIDKEVYNAYLYPKKTVNGDYMRFLVRKYLLGDTEFWNTIDDDNQYVYVEQKSDENWAWATVFLGITYDESEELFESGYSIEDIIENFTDISRNYYMTTEEMLEEIQKHQVA